MGAVTYPDERVVAFLNDRFACVKLDIFSKVPAEKATTRRFRVLWNPAFVVLNDRDEEMRRWIGYLPPEAFIAELRVGAGKVRILGRDPKGAHEDFRAAADTEDAPVAPEAAYWTGIAKYLAAPERDKTILSASWNELRERFPDSRWWTAADT